MLISSLIMPLSFIYVSTTSPNLTTQGPGHFDHPRFHLPRFRFFQDANECWLQIVRMLQQQVKLNSDAPQSSIAESSAQTSLIEKYFGKWLVMV